MQERKAALGKKLGMVILSSDDVKFAHYLDTFTSQTTFESGHVVLRINRV